MVNIAIEWARRKVQSVLNQKNQLQREYDEKRMSRELFIDKMQDLQCEYYRYWLWKRVLEDPRI